VGDLSASHLCNDVYASQPAADGVWLLLTFLSLYLFFSSARACWAIEMICTEQWNTTTKRKARPVFYFETPFIVTQQSSSDSSTVREIIKRAVYITVCVSKEQRILLTRKRPNEKDMYPAKHRRALNKKKTKKSNAFDCFSLFRNNALHASANARKTYKRNKMRWTKFEFQIGAWPSGKVWTIGTIGAFQPTRLSARVESGRGWKASLL
jgi:hypothetical protein